MKMQSIFFWGVVAYLLLSDDDSAGIGRAEIPLKEILNDEPGTVRDAIIFYFLEGGRVNTEDFVRATGLEGEDMRSYIWAYSNSAPYASDILNNSISPIVREQNFDQILAERELWEIVLRGKKAMIEEATEIYKAKQGLLDYPEGEYCMPTFAITYTSKYGKCRQPYTQFGDEAAMRNILRHIKEAKKKGEMQDIVNPRIKKVV